MTDQTLYLTTVGCQECDQSSTFAHEGPTVPLDQSPPWPAARFCPICGEYLPDDLGEVVEEVREATVVLPAPSAGGDEA